MENIENITNNIEMLIHSVPLTTKQRIDLLNGLKQLYEAAINNINDNNAKIK